MKPQRVYTTRIAGDYPSYAAALAECPQAQYAHNMAGTFDAESFGRSHAKNVAASKGRLNVDRSIRTLPYLAATGLYDRTNLSILDVGGGSGTFFYNQRAVIGSCFRPCYDILEAPEVAMGGAALKDQNIGFFGDVQEIAGRRYSYVAFGGVLQILENPRRFFSDVLAAVECDHVLITTFPMIVGQRRDRIALKGHRTSGDILEEAHPYWVFSDSWIRLFESVGDIVMRFEMPTYRFNTNGTVHPQRGFLIRRHPATVHDIGCDEEGQKAVVAD